MERIQIENSEEEKNELQSRPRVLSKEEQLRPWEALVRPNVSDALAELMEEIIQKFIIPWHSLISADSKFPNECRSSLRYASVKGLTCVKGVLRGYTVLIMI